MYKHTLIKASKRMAEIIPWISFAASILVMLTSGSIFTFSSFSEDFRQKLGYSAKDINLVSGLGNAAVYIAFLLAGVLYDRLGANITMISSAITYGTGYLLMYLTFRGIIPGNVGSMSFYYFLAGYGSSAIYLVATAINLVNFKNEKVRGITLGILLLFYGLSATLYAQIYSYAFSSNGNVDTAGFLLLLTLTAFLVNGVGAFLIVDVNKLTWLHNSTEDVKNNENTKGQSNVRDYSMDSVKIQSSGLNANETTEKTLSPIEKTISKSDIPEESRLSVVKRLSVTITDTSQPVWCILKTLPFWLYATIAIWQQGLTYMVNISLILTTITPLPQALDRSFIATESALHVTLLSIGQSLGRFFFGIASQIRRPGLLFDSSFLLVVAEVLLVIPCFLLAVVGDMGYSVLYASSILVGIGYGAAGGLFPGLVREFFGMKNYGTASGLVLTGVPIGILVSNQIFGAFYDSEVSAQKILGSALECQGTNCFRRAFLVFLAIQLIAACFSLYLWIAKKAIVAKRKKVHVDDVPDVVPQGQVQQQV